MLVARTGKEGLAVARRELPDVILLDLHMPEMDGWSVLEMLGKDDFLRVIPTIVISINDDRRTSLEMGAVDHMTKPVNKTVLAELLALYKQPCTGNLLIADADSECVDRIGRIGASAGFSVMEAGSASAVRDLLATTHVSILVADLDMPDAGLKLVREIRQNEELAEIPVAIVASRELSDVERDEILETVQMFYFKGALAPRQIVTDFRAVSGGQSAQVLSGDVAVA